MSLTIRKYAPFDVFHDVVYWWMDQFVSGLCDFWYFLIDFQSAQNIERSMLASCPLAGRQEWAFFLPKRP